jgi:dTDP-4-dehydrorhamnose 3,5-epimerase-like enzyme
MLFDKKKASVINLPRILDDRGNLSFLENGSQIPFDIKRVYWIYDVPGGEYRGGHAYRELQEVVVALSGSFDVVLNDGTGSKTYSLNRSYYGLYIPKMIWRHLENFSTNALAFIVTDQYYTEDQYIRDFETYKKLANEQ